MKEVIESIRELNTIQKLFLATAISLAALIILAHNPFSGYQTKIVSEYYYDKPLPECTDKEKEEYREFLIGLANSKRYPEFERITNFDPMVSKCHRLGTGLFMSVDSQPEKVITTTELPFNQWSSNAPLINWFGIVINSIISFIAIAIISLVFFIVFSDRIPTQK